MNALRALVNILATILGIITLPPLCPPLTFLPEGDSNLDFVDAFLSNKNNKIGVEIWRGALLSGLWELGEWMVFLTTRVVRICKSVFLSLRLFVGHP